MSPVVDSPDVETKLIEAATELLAERSPRRISGRELAQHAGVNYGQIHHYFGSKDAVFARAFAEYQAEVYTRQSDGGSTEPLPIDTSAAAGQFSTLAHLSLGEELPEGDFPTIRSFVRLRAERTGRPEDNPDVLAEVAAVAAMQLGWGVFEQFIMSALEPWEPDLDDLRSRVAELSVLLDPNE